MSRDSVAPNTNEVARSSRRATFASLATGFLFFALLIIGLGYVIRSQQIGDISKVMALMAVTLGLLFFGLALLGDLFVRRYRWRWDAPLMILVWAYLIPAIYFLCICVGFTTYSQNLRATLLGTAWALLYQTPILWFWQGTMLAWFLLRVKRKNPFQIFSMPRGEAIPSGLAGFGAALIVIFTFSILSNLFPILQPYGTISLDGGGAMPFIFILLALSLFPWAEEVFFREMLPDSITGGIGSKAAMVCSALLFALLAFRWVFFLPFFLLGLGLGVLKAKRGLPSAVITHIFCNLVVLGLFSGFLF